MSTLNEFHELHPITGVEAVAAAAIMDAASISGFRMMCGAVWVMMLSVMFEKSPAVDRLSVAAGPGMVAVDVGADQRLTTWLTGVILKVKS